MEITICIGSSCHLRGSREIINRLEKLVRENSLQDKVELKGSFCMEQCQKGVCVTVDGVLHSLTPENTEEFFNSYVLGVVK